MIPKLESLLEATENFSDTEELANALRSIADDDECIGPAAAYYLRESADHMEGLYREYLWAIRYLRKNARLKATSNFPDTDNVDFKNEP